MEKKFWIIAVANTAADGVFLAKFVGTKEQVIKKLSEMMREDQENDLESFDYAGDLGIPEVNEYGDIYGCNVFSDYHIDYTASSLDDMKEA